jgi:UDP-N-acetylmuramate: L-alanyl-gamma-D-glutamyl-meso-diaminopimelate ligase
MRIFLCGIAGTGMGSFAGLLRAAGHEVAGSDENVYPPMSDKLTEWRIPFFTPYDPANFARMAGGKPDLVVVGNALRAENPEAKALRRQGIPHMSFPEALDELFLATRHSVVVAGTHGKTTATSLLAHVLHHAGRDPSLLVGGVPLNFNEGFRLGKGEHFVLEGDEYDSAYFDKGAKFLHYRPRSAIYTGAEFDHADIYRDLPHYESAFEKFFALLPQDGFLAACSSFPNWKRLAGFAKCKVESYSAVERGGADWSANWLQLGPSGAAFEVAYRDKPEKRVQLNAAGRHNVENALGVFAVCRALGLTADQIAEGFASFRGVKRRQELRGEVGGVAVIDDFAHHPTAVRETITAIAAQYPGQRLIAVFEPRSNTAMRKIHQDEYAHAFGSAAEALISQPSALAKVPENERVDAKKMAADIVAAGTRARWMASPDAIVEALAREAKSGDVVLVMSNGAFGGLHDKLLSALAARKAS